MFFICFSLNLIAERNFPLVFAQNSQFISPVKMIKMIVLFNCLLKFNAFVLTFHYYLLKFLVLLILRNQAPKWIKPQNSGKFDVKIQRATVKVLILTIIWLFTRVRIRWHQISSLNLFNPKAHIVGVVNSCELFFHAMFCRWMCYEEQRKQTVEACMSCTVTSLFIPDCDFTVLKKLATN